MEWQWLLLIIFGGFMLLMVTGMPVAFCFLLVNVIGLLLIVGPQAMIQLPNNLFNSLTTFTFLPIVLFVLLGELVFRADIAPRMMDALDLWLWRIPGRLGLLAVASGTVLSTLTGASMATTAILGSSLVPEMEKRGYKKPMSLGPVLGSGGLAIMIPPSDMAILIGVLGMISVGQILIATLIPGLLMAILYAGYIIIRCWLQPSIAPAYQTPPVPLYRKLKATACYILPLGLIFFGVVGFIFLGIATPSEAAATGTLAAFILAAAYGRLNWQVLKKTMVGTTSICVMMFVIMMTSKIYAQLLAHSGATQGLVEFISSLPLATIFIMILLQIVPLILGMFMGATAVVMIAIPLVMPIIRALGIDQVLYAITLLLCVEMGTTSPPYGLSLFVMKAVAPPDTTMGDIYRSALPFLGCDLIALISIVIFPPLTGWLPALIR